MFATLLSGFVGLIVRLPFVPYFVELVGWCDCSFAFRLLLCWAWVCWFDCSFAFCSLLCWVGWLVWLFVCLSFVTLLCGFVGLIVRLAFVCYFVGWFGWFIVRFPFVCYFVEWVCWFHCSFAVYLLFCWVGWLWLIVRFPFVCYFVEWVGCLIVVRLPFVCYSVEWVGWFDCRVRFPFVYFFVSLFVCCLCSRRSSHLYSCPISAQCQRLARWHTKVPARCCLQWYKIDTKSLGKQTGIRSIPHRPSLGFQSNPLDKQGTQTLGDEKVS